jgi:hypothetical protein
MLNAIKSLSFSELSIKDSLIFSGVELHNISGDKFSFGTL